MFSQHTILVVEDNEDDIILAQRAFRKAGVDAPLQIVRNGDDAIRYLEASASDLDTRRKPLPAMILLDLKLPKRNGFEVLHWIRSHPIVSMVPVVIFTTSTQSSDLARAYSLGANSYLKKPATLDATTSLLKLIGVYWLIHNESPPPMQRS